MIVKIDAINAFQLIGENEAENALLFSWNNANIDSVLVVKQANGLDSEAYSQKLKFYIGPFREEERRSKRMENK